MYGDLSFSQNNNGTYDLYVRYPQGDADAIYPAAILRQTGSVIRSGAPLRTAADPAAKELETLQIGAIVTVLDEAAGWCHIQPTGGITGYLESDDLQQHKIGVVTPKTGAYVLSQPTADSQIIYIAQSGTPMAILDEYDSGWCKIQLSDQRVGYLPGVSLARASLHTPIVIKTSSAALRLRSLPSQSAESRGYIPAGEQLLVLDAGDSEFAKISYGDTVAYVSASFLN